MKDKTEKINLTGSSGCMFWATPARIYNQFSSYCSAFLFYDFVLIGDLNTCIHLHSGGPDSKEIMRKSLLKIKELGIGIDPEDVIPVSARSISIAEISKWYSDERLAQTVFSELDSLNKNAKSAFDDHELYLAKLKSDQQSEYLSVPKSEYELERTLGNQRNVAIRRYEDTLCRTFIKSRGFNLDDGTKNDWNWDANTNDQLRPILLDGQLPVWSDCDSDFPIEKGQEYRTFCLTLGSIPFPEKMPPMEFVDFRNSKVVRQSIRKFRQLAADLTKGQSPAKYVVDEIVGRYHDYKQEVAKLKTKAVLGSVKFVISNLVGLGEDIIKFRLESLTKRPFDIAEFIIDKKYVQRDHLDSPFYFLLSKDAK